MDELQALIGLVIVPVSLIASGAALIAIAFILLIEAVFSIVDARR